MIESKDESKTYQEVSTDVKITPSEIEILDNSLSFYEEREVELDSSIDSMVETADDKLDNTTGVGINYTV